MSSASIYNANKRGMIINIHARRCKYSRASSFRPTERKSASRSKTSISATVLKFEVSLQYATSWKTLKRGGNTF